MAVYMKAISTQLSAFSKQLQILSCWLLTADGFHVLLCPPGHGCLYESRQPSAVSIQLKAFMFCCARQGMAVIIKERKYYQSIIKERPAEGVAGHRL
jgi:hypothetical protein